MTSAANVRRPRLRVEFKRNELAVMIYALESVIDEYKAGAEDHLIVDELRLRDKLEARLRRYDRAPR